MKFSESVRPISYLKSHTAEALRNVSATGGTMVITQHGEAKAYTQGLIDAIIESFDPADDERMIANTRALYDALEPHTGGYYDNINSDGVDTSSNYGPVYDRLVSVKNVIDPINLFRLNSNIMPTV